MNRDPRLTLILLLGLLLAPIAAAVAQTGVGGAGPINPGQHPFVSNTVVSPGVSLTTGVAADVVTVPVPPGDWQVCITLYAAPAATTVTSLFEGSISTTANTRNTTAGAFVQSVPGTTQTNVTNFLCDRLVLAATTTVRLVALANFSTSTITAYGKIQARRMR
jgi:hypothetical protein